MPMEPLEKQIKPDVTRGRLRREPFNRIVAEVGQDCVQAGVTQGLGGIAS